MHPAEDREFAAQFGSSRRNEEEIIFSARRRGRKAFRARPPATVKYCSLSIFPGAVRRVTLRNFTVASGLENSERKTNASPSNYPVGFGHFFRSRLKKSGKTFNAEDTEIAENT